MVGKDLKDSKVGDFPCRSSTLADFTLQVGHTAVKQSASSELLGRRRVDVVICKGGGHGDDLGSQGGGSRSCPITEE